MGLSIDWIAHLRREVFGSWVFSFCYALAVLDVRFMWVRGLQWWNLKRWGLGDKSGFKGVVSLMASVEKGSV